jgi:hypothetical protein
MAGWMERCSEREKWSHDITICASFQETKLIILGVCSATQFDVCLYVLKPNARARSGASNTPRRKGQQSSKILEIINTVYHIMSKRITNPCLQLTGKLLQAKTAARQIDKLSPAFVTESVYG